VATQTELAGKVAEAFGRFEANRVTAARYREHVLPSLSRAYRATAQRYMTEPDAVTFDGIVKLQQDLGQALQGYLTALDAQWRAVVDLANLGQLDDLFPPAYLISPWAVAPVAGPARCRPRGASG
jgi:hypothetical protein